MIHETTMYGTAIKYTFGKKIIVFLMKLKRKEEFHIS